MLGKQAVMIKGQKDGISITINDAEFDEIKSMLRQKVKRSKRFFEGADTNIFFKGIALTEAEEQTLLEIISEETSLAVNIVVSQDSGKQSREVVPRNAPALQDAASTQKQEMQIQATAPAEHVTALPLQPSATNSAPNWANHSQSNTAYYHGGLRSGQHIKFDGSVVIMGDVNPGSEVVASGNVVVLGSLKGMAHAGATGNEACFVSALVLLPTQLRIASKITYIEAEKKGVRGVKEPVPSYAYVKDGQVHVAVL